MQNTRELAPVAQAGGRVSTVQWLRRNQNGKERHGNWCAEKQALGVRSSPRSLCLSVLLTLPLSLSSLSLSPAGLRLELRALARPSSCRPALPLELTTAVVRRAALPCAASGQDVGSTTPSMVTPC